MFQYATSTMLTTRGLVAGQMGLLKYACSSVCFVEIQVDSNTVYERRGEVLVHYFLSS